MSSLPTPLRAALGLFATALDTVQELVEHAPELPMEAVGNSMQLSMRLQQQYTALLTRGDEFLAGLRGAPEEPPAWATFDESPVSGESAESAAQAFSGDEFAEHPDPAGSADLPDAEIQDEPRHAGQGDPLLAAVVTPHFTDLAPAAEPAGGATTRSTPAKAPRPARKSSARKTTPVPTVNAAATKAGAKKAGAKKAGAVKAGAKKASTAKAVAVKKAAAPAAGSIPAGNATAGTVTARNAATRKATTGTAAARRATARKATAGKAASEDAARAAAPRAAAKRAPRTAPPTLDANLDNGDASARALSAFDRAPGPTETTDATVPRLPGAAPDPSTSDAPAAD